MSKPKSKFNKFLETTERGKERRDAKKSVLVVVEGMNTEPDYFEELRRHFRMPDTLFHLMPGGSGIPATLVELAKQEIKNHERKRKKKKLPHNAPEFFDEVWIVFDTEAAQLAGRLDDGVEAAKKAKVEIAHSTPCFEFWVALHFKPDAPPMTTCAEAIRHLKKVGEPTCDGYDKKRAVSRKIMAELVPMIDTAVMNAEIVTSNQEGEDFPANPSTAVHLLVKSLQEGMA